MSSPPDSALSTTRFADLIAGYCLEVRPGQQVLVRSTSLAAPLLLELQRAILERGAWPLLRVELPGPRGAWGELGAFQAALIERLARARELRIEADGTDLALRVERRTWVNSDGRRNMPSGEVFTGPVETSAHGHVYFDVPSSPA